MNMVNFTKHNKNQFSQAGYTLFELLVVMIILSILASVALNSLQPNVDIVKTKETQKELDEISNAIVGNRENISGGKQIEYGYVGDIGSLPSSLTDLVTNPGYSTWDGPYIKDDFYSSSGSTEYEYLLDGWGTAYNYSGSNTISSTGGSSTITKKIANSTADILYNSVSFNVYDSSFCPPGDVMKDSVEINLTIPDGIGSMVTLSKHPHSDGFVSFDSIPIGLHNLNVVEYRNNDTLKRKIDIELNSDIHVNLQLPISIWCDTGSGGSSSPGAEILRPNGSGQYSQLNDFGCSYNWQCVSETSSDGNATYIEGHNNSYQRDLYTLSDLSISSGSIDSIAVHIVVIGGNSNNEAQTYLRTGNSNLDGSIISLVSVTDYTEYSTTYVLNPETSSAWTLSQINDLEAGVRLRQEARCTQVWVEVFYTN